MLSMTQSTESKEKKEIWEKEGIDSGLRPPKCLLLQMEPPSCTGIHAWST